jgi:ligand-binding SRPBCC domain-containing protein
MKTAIFTIETPLPAPAATVYAWHENPEALGALSPESAGIEILQPAKLEVGAIAHLRVPLIPGLLKSDWLAEIDFVQPGLEFRDRQIKGPFKYWYHRHLFIPNGSGCLMRDVVEFRIPGGTVMHHLGTPFVMSELKKMFNYRHQKLIGIFGKQDQVCSGESDVAEVPEIHPENPILRYADEF